jgi:hypothetical protein
MDMKTIRLYAAMSLWVLLAVSCENGEVAGGGSGKMVEVRVMVPSLREGGAEEVMRSAHLSPLTGRREIAMTSQPLGNGMLLDMSLEPDEVSELRATPIALEAGKTFRVIALNASTHKYVSHADFTIVAGSANSSTALHVLEGVAHDFICLSHHGSNTTEGLFATTYSSTEEPADLAVPVDGKDLLYAHVLGKTINNNSEATLSFTLAHRLSKVTLVVDGSYNGWAVTSVASTMYVQPYYAEATMRLRDGAMTKGSSKTDRYFSDWAVVDTYTRKSAPCTVFTNDEAMMLVVPQNAITINSTPQPSAAKTVSFATVPSLVAGHSYTLHLRIRLTRWAGSNIYWQAVAGSTDPKYPGYLTFDAEGTTTNQGYQGVLFKWGSLVGISPARRGTSDEFSSSVPVYIPICNTGTLTASTWSSPTTSSYTVASWDYTVNGTAEDAANNIPYMDGRAAFNDPNSGRNSTFVMDAARNDPTEMWAKGRGDICQYLGATGAGPTGYRLPTSNEMGTSSSTAFDTSTPVAGGWVKGTGSFTATNGAGYPNGRADLLSNQQSASFDPSKHTHGASTDVLGSAQNIAMGNVILPASGYRSSGSGNLYGLSVGNQGFYWSGSANDATKSHYLYFFSYTIHPESNGIRSHGFAIRCVRN